MHSREQAEEALSILLSQIGNARIREMHSKKLKAYLGYLHKRIELADRIIAKEDWSKVDDHIQALAKLWDEQDAKCPPHNHL
jgi:hypothetical protein